MVAPGHRVAKLWHPLAGEGQHRARLGSRGDLELLEPIHRFHLNGVAENRLEIIQADF